VSLHLRGPAGLIRLLVEHRVNPNAYISNCERGTGRYSGNRGFGLTFGRRAYEEDSDLTLVIAVFPLS
jgi:hypothetical protein